VQRRDGQAEPARLTGSPGHFVGRRARAAVGGRAGLGEDVAVAVIGMWSALAAGAPCAVGIAALVGAVAGEPPATRVPSRRCALMGLFAVAVGALAGVALAAVVGEPLLGVSVAAGAWLVGAAGALWLARGARRPDDDADGPDPGGGGGGGPGAPAPDGPGGGAVDWEAFEREFWRHVHRGRQPVR
jgi:type IV secretion system protein TrbL